MDAYHATMQGQARVLMQPRRFNPPRRALRRGAGALLLAVLAGCATIDPSAPRYDPALISGERLFDAPLDPARVPHVDIVSPNPAMQAFVATHVTDARLSVTRLRRLLQGLLEEGFFNHRYDPLVTLTAQEAFQARSGNCLSYTNMFIALAREAGLDAVYQVVDIPPTWDADAGFLIRYTHINVLLRGVRIERAPGEIVTVDFNDVLPDPEHPRRPVSDDYAASLYYANHAVEFLRRNELADAFAYLRRAIELEPGNPDLWVNLAALYGRRDDIRSAIEAYEVALQIDPRNRAALAGLARSHTLTGETALAARYEARVRDYLESNAYYHLALAQAALERAEPDRALESIDRAIRLKRRSGRLHFVKGLIHERLGDLDAARESFRTARRLGISNPAKLEHMDRAGRQDARPADGAGRAGEAQGVDALAAQGILPAGLNLGGSPLN
ncbi:MAG: tetratricopeptide repeat protein [Pseudomonadales bacterium]|nr:tetratricopeptide repeat protein [Pseudomonadales bacterium]